MKTTGTLKIQLFLTNLLNAEAKEMARWIEEELLVDTIKLVPTGDEYLTSILLEDHYPLDSFEFDLCFLPLKYLVSIGYIEGKYIGNPPYKLSSSFKNLVNLKAIDFENIILTPTRYCGNSKEIAKPMFENCNSLEEINAEFDLTQFSSLKNMFKDCFKLKKIPNLTLRNSVDTSNMFANCYSLDAITFNNCPFISKMDGMFSYCYSLVNIPEMNTELVESMKEAFFCCNSLTEVSLCTDHLKNAIKLFAGCKRLTKVSGLNLAKLKIGDEMFDGCKNLKFLNEDNSLRCYSLQSAYSMFGDCRTLESNPPTLTFSTPAFCMFPGTNIKPTFEIIVSDIYADSKEREESYKNPVTCKIINKYK